MNNTTINKAQQLGQNIATSVLLQQLLKEAQHQHLVERALTLDQVAALIMASQSPAEA